MACLKTCVYGQPHAGRIPTTWRSADREHGLFTVARLGRSRGMAKKPRKSAAAKKGIKKGGHWEDNQGCCHGCGILLCRYIWELYAGKGAAHPDD